MSFLFRRQGKEGKRKTEHRLYLAKESPDPSVDLSECDLHEVIAIVTVRCESGSLFDFVLVCTGRDKTK